VYVIFNICTDILYVGFLASRDLALRESHRTPRADDVGSLGGSSGNYGLQVRMQRGLPDTHTHTHIYIYIYIYRERERE